MTVHYSDDHVGRLVVDSGAAVQTEIDGVTLGDARRAFDDLAAHRSPTITAADGSVHLVDGLRYIAAMWEPEKR